MSDYTEVFLTILRTDHARFIHILNNAEATFRGGDVEHNHPFPTDDHIVYEFTDVYGAALGFEAELITKGIPFDKSWHACDVVPAGNAYSRYNADGTHHEFQINDEDVNPPLNELVKLVSDNKLYPDERLLNLTKFILKHHEMVTPLPWDDQVANSKLFRTRQLLLEAEAV